ncbi:MAG: quinone oxidoreductase [Woeseia sp.]|nr:quinone oxidoreductase [Woeseia sp.]NNE61714.1 quinone oxidoreductase [Woeseia sp.]NNL55090.1 quinone oxidoreductase [Woeseia sp.]
MKANAIRMHEYGGPEVLQFVEVEVPDPGPGEARIRHSAIGLNLIDTYHRSGLYPGTLPAGLGSEAAGVIDAVGPGVSAVKVGDRVVYTGRPPDSYSEYRVFPAERLVPIPDGLEDEQAAAVLLKGLTAWYLLHRSYPVNPGDDVLLYAAAGGVGTLAAQWGRHLGARVIGVVSTEEKALLARQNGCADIVMAHDDIAARVRELTNEKGVAAVYDSVGKDTFMASLDCLRPHGVMVSFGNASGPVAPFAPAELAKRHSLYVTRPVLFDFVESRDELLAACEALFGAISAGVMAIHVNQRYALKDAAQAHRDIEARKTTGSTVLLP